MTRINYGLDAPGIMRNLLAFGILLLIVGLIVAVEMQNTFMRVAGWLVFVFGSVLFLLGLAMLLYGLEGKYRTRDLMIKKINWKGSEHVLDIGTGQGLLMNAAAKKLMSGKCIGIDLWIDKDLSSNSIQKVLSNAALEGVQNKIEVKTEDARNLSFADNSFDVILSLLCIHNIEPKEDQAKACREIARVLKPGGTVLIGDYIPTTEYAKTLASAGLNVKSSKPYFSTALALMWIVEATK